MDLQELKRQRIGILGMGVNNAALVAWLIRHRLPNITICDQNPAIRLDYPQWEGKVTWRLGNDYLKHLTDFQTVFRTPGIPYLSPPIQQAKRAGVTITSQTQLFFDLCPAPIIGVTGTKGKGTTATLTSEILKVSEGGEGHVYLAGNIGTDPFTFLDDLTDEDVVILELSSFQLQDMSKSPHIAVILDITSDHLDHHASRDEYVTAKKQIVKYQTVKDYTVLNADSASAMEFGELTAAPVWFFSRRKAIDQGAYVRWAVGSDSRWGEIILVDRAGKEHAIARTYDLKLRGEHNLENVTAAITAAYLAGATIPAIKKVVPSFAGLVHRLELVGTWEGRSFYNDSFATNPEPVIAAVRSFSEPIHLIAGGSTKGAEYMELGKIIAGESSVQSFTPLGTVEGPRIAAAIKEHDQKGQITIFPPAGSMQEAVLTATRGSQPGDVILLSPGAASFDLFENYKKRGDAFRHVVAGLARGSHGS